MLALDLELQQPMLHKWFVIERSQVFAMRLKETGSALICIYLIVNAKADALKECMKQRKRNKSDLATSPICSKSD